MEKSRESVDLANLRSAYAAAQVQVLTDATVTSTDVTKYYSPAAGSLVDATVACGKGTATDGGTVVDLPTVCTYTTSTSVKDKGIEVVYNEDGVKSVQFK